MLQVIKHIFYIIRMLLNVISRPTGSNVYKVGNRTLYGYVYVICNTFTNSVYIGSSISQDKIEDIRQTYYRSSKYMVRIIHKSCSSNHKDRQLRLQELKNYYYNMYSKNHIVLQI